MKFKKFLHFYSKRGSFVIKKHCYYWQITENIKKDIAYFEVFPFAKDWHENIDTCPEYSNASVAGYLAIRNTQIDPLVLDFDPKTKEKWK